MLSGPLADDVVGHFATCLQYMLNRNASRLAFKALAVSGVGGHSGRPGVGAEDERRGQGHFRSLNIVFVEAKI